MSRYDYVHCFVSSMISVNALGNCLKDICADRQTYPGCMRILRGCAAFVGVHPLQRNFWELVAKTIGLKLEVNIFN